MYPLLNSIENFTVIHWRGPEEECSRPFTQSSKPASLGCLSHLAAIGRGWYWCSWLQNDGIRGLHVLMSVDIQAST